MTLAFALVLESVAFGTVVFGAFALGTVALVLEAFGLLGLLGVFNHSSIYLFMLEQKFPIVILITFIVVLNTKMLK